MADKRELLLVIKGRDQGASKALGDIADAADDAKDDLQGMNVGLKKLDGQIATSTKRVEGLRREIAKSGDLGLVKDLEKAQRELAKLTRQRKLTLGVEVDRDITRIDARLSELTRRREALIEADADESKIAKVRAQIEELTRRRKAIVDIQFDRDAANRAAHGLDDLLADAADEAGGGFATRLVARIGPLVISKAPALGAAGGAIGAGLAAGAVPVIGAAVAGGIIGGVGVGGVVGGLAIASRHTAVKAAGETLRVELSGVLERSAVSFVPAAIEGIDIIRGKIRASEGDLTEIFVASSKFVRPLAEGVGDALQDVIAGFAGLASKAGPVITVLAGGIRRLGESIEEGLGDLEDNANEGAEALAITFAVIDYGVRTTFKLVDGLAEAYGFMMGVAGLLRGDPGPLIRNAYEDAHQAQEATGGLSEGLQALLEGFKQTGDAASTATADIRDFYAIVNEGVQTNLTAKAAQRELEQAIDDATETIKENGRNLDINTQKGRDNEAALDEIRRTAWDTAAAIRDAGGSQDQANAALERGRRAYVEAAVAAGANRKKVEELSYQLFGLPSPKPKVTVQTAEAKAEIEVVKAKIDGIKGKTVNIRVGIWWVEHGRNRGDLKVPGGYQTKDRWGGMHVPMASGGVMSAGIYPASNPPLIQFAEPATGGEAYIPRRGNRSRSVQILSEAARWYGMDVVPHGAASGGGAGPVAIEAAARAGARAAGRELLGLLSRAKFRIDDRNGRFVDLLVRGG